MLDILFIILGLELSIANGGYATYNAPDYYTNYYENRYYVKFDAKIILFKYLYLEGSIETPVYLQEDKINFWPTGLFSTIAIGIEINNLIIEYKHNCTHPVTSYDRRVDYRNLHDSYENRISIKYKTDKLKIF